MFLKHIITRTGVQSAGLVIQFGLLIFTNRALGVEGRGIVAAATSWSSLFFLIGSAGLPLAILNAAPNSDEEDVGRIASTTLFMGAALGLLTCVVGAWLYAGLKIRWFGSLGWYHFLLALAPIPFMMAQVNLATVLQARALLNQYNALALLQILLNAVLVILALVTGRYNVEVALGLVIIIQVVSFIVTIWMTCRNLVTQWYPSRNWMLKLLRNALVVHLGTIATYVYLKADLLIVNALLGQEATGLYAMAAMLAGAMQVLPSAIQAMLYPKAAEGTLQEGTRRVLQASRLTSMTMVTVALVMIPLAYPAVSLLGGRAFSGAGLILWLLLPGLVFFSIPMVFSALWVRMGLFTWASGIAIAGAAIGVALELSLIPLWGLPGAAVATSLTQGTVMILVLWTINRKTEHRWREAIGLRSEDLRLIWYQACSIGASIK